MEERRGAGLFKFALAGGGVLIQVLCNISQVADHVGKLSRMDHGITSTIVFSFFVVYVLADILKWRDDWTVWAAGFAALAMAAYWWIGFLGKHGLPQEPILPPRFLPPQWAYLLLAGGLGLWSFWDMADAMKEEYDDRWSVKLASGSLIVGVVLALYLTLNTVSASAYQFE